MVALVGQYDTLNRDQGYTKITRFLKQAIQRGLIDDRAGQERITVLFEGDGEALEPIGPLRSQVAFEPDLIDHHSTWVTFGVEFVQHVPVSAAPGDHGPGRLLIHEQHIGKPMLIARP